MNRAIQKMNEVKRLLKKAKQFRPNQINMRFSKILPDEWVSPATKKEPFGLLYEILLIFIFMGRMSCIGHYPQRAFR